ELFVKAFGRRFQVFLWQRKVTGLYQMGQVTGPGILEVFPRRLLEQLKQFSACSDRRNLLSLDTPFEIARDRFMGADAQNCLRVRRAFTHYDSNIGKLVAFLKD